MMKFMSLIFVLGAVTLYHPYAEAQRGGGGSRGGGSSGGSRGGGSSSGGYGNSGSRGGSSSGGYGNSGSRGGSSSGGYGNSGSRGGSSSGGYGNSGSRGGSSSGGYGNGGSRGGVASPVVNNSRTDVSSSTRRGRETITYSDRSSGRTVMQESYSRDRSTMTRNFYDRNQRISQSCNYERRRYHNTVYVYVYQPYHVWYEDYYWYHPFCSSGYYHNYWSYSWGWYNDPWYHYYGYYYRPYARYVYPSEWLVDYYWASLLADEYQDRVDQGTINTQQSTIQTQQSTIDAQQAEIDALKAQLKKQVDDEMVARKSGDTVALDTKLLDANHVYVVSTNMTLVTADAQAITCNLSSGDVISLAKEGIASNAQTATMLVRSAKSGNCTAGVKVLVSIEQLQEFENEFNRRLDAGAEKMKADPTVSQVLDPNPQEEVE